MHPSILRERDQIVAACQRYAVQRLEIFGSAVRGDFDAAASDADFLVEFAPNSKSDHYLDLKETFERILGRPVDLVDRRAIQASRNYIRRSHVLSEAEPFYVA